MIKKTNDKIGIVFVDDHEVELYFFEQMLSKYYNVYATSTPLEALNLLSQDDVIAIISDHEMPQMSGIELLQQALFQFPSKGRILITVNNKIEVIKDAINKAEINQFIAKPCDEDSLKFAIDRVVETCQLKLSNSSLQKELKSTIDRQHATLANQKKIIKLNQVVIKKLNRSKNIQNGRWEKGIQEVTETVALNLNISRVGVWSYNREKDNGICIDLFSLDKNEHKSGYPLDRKNYEGITDVILNEWIVQVEDVNKNVGARLPTFEYLKKHDIRSVLYIPFYIGRKVFGVLTCEQQHEIIHWSNDEVQFLTSLTDIIKLAYRTYERKLVEEKLKIAYDDLQSTHSQLVLAEKMMSLGQLTAGIAHEINNPINFVYAGINALDKDIEHCLKLTELYTSMNGNDNLIIVNQIKEMRSKIDFNELKEDIRSLVKNIRIGATRTAEIVKGLRNFSRLDEAERKMASIHEGIDSTLILIRGKLENRIQLLKNYDQNIPLIYCYPGQLNQVFMNILSNAMQAIKKKGSIEIATIDTVTSVEIHISDSGSGIPQNIVEKIFDPFFTTKEVGEGTGLGLSISYGIIKKHNGEITVESIEGKGTKFIISLPKQAQND